MQNSETECEKQEGDEMVTWFEPIPSEPPVLTDEALQSFSAQPLVSKAPPPQRPPLSWGRMVSAPW